MSTTGEWVCSLCGQCQCICETVPLGPWLTMSRHVSAEEIRQIVREELEILVKRMVTRDGTRIRLHD